MLNKQNNEFFIELTERLTDFSHPSKTFLIVRSGPSNVYRDFVFDQSRLEFDEGSDDAPKRRRHVRKVRYATSDY